MGIFVVRLAESADAPPVLVGIYVAASVAELRGQVEQACPTRTCEFAEVPGGCLYDRDTVNAGGTLASDSDPAGFMLTSPWDRLFIGAPKPTWQALDDAGWQSPSERDAALTSARRMLENA